MNIIPKTPYLYRDIKRSGYSNCEMLEYCKLLKSVMDKYPTEIDVINNISKSIEHYAHLELNKLKGEA